MGASIPHWVKVHEEESAGGSRGRRTWRLKIQGGWLLLVRSVDDGIWGGVTFLPDPPHECPPEALPE